MTLRWHIGTVSCAVLLLSCDPTVSVGNADSGVHALGSGNEGEPCECAGSSCCDEGLICFIVSSCETSPGPNCTAQNTCSKKRALGETCHDSSECAEPGAHCSSASPDGPATCKVYSGDLDAQRCDSSSTQCSSADGIRRVCIDTYCKRMAGEVCGASSQCVSNKCYGSTTFVCL